MSGMTEHSNRRDFLVLLSALLAFSFAHVIGRRVRRLSVAAEQLGRGEVPVIDQRTRQIRAALATRLHSPRPSSR